MGDASTQLVDFRPAGLPSPNPTESFWQSSYPNSISNYRSRAGLPSHATVTVIGSGISGAFAAQELLEHGVDVLVLEARTVCSGATGRNGGHLQPLVHGARPGIIDFEMANFDHVEGLVSSGNVPCDFRRLPGCVGFYNKVYFEEAKADLAKACAIEPRFQQLVRVVEDPVELGQQLRLKGAVGAFVQQVAASLSPYRLIIWLWRGMLAKHSQSSSHARLNLQSTTPVERITQQQQQQQPQQEQAAGHGRDGYYILHTARGTVHTNHVIVATNGYTSHLLPQFSRLLSPVQAQMSALVPPQGSPFSRSLIPVSYGFLGVGPQDRQMSDYLVQNPLLADGTGGGHLMYGGGRAQARGHGVGVSDDDYVDQDAEAYLRDLGSRLDLLSRSADYEGVAEPELLDIAGSWTGIIGSSIDGHPWVGGVPDMPGVWLCAGYTGHGMTNAGLCGRHVAALVRAHLRGDDWRQLEAEEISGARGKVAFPAEYVLSRERMQAAGAE